MGPLGGVVTATREIANTLLDLLQDICDKCMLSVICRRVLHNLMEAENCYFHLLLFLNRVGLN